LIENVGNLVCPAIFDLGESAKVAILSMTEGDDKPIKYPHMFQAASLLLINKIDLLPLKAMLKKIAAAAMALWCVTAGPASLMWAFGTWAVSRTGSFSPCIFVRGTSLSFVVAQFVLLYQ
jgi:CobW/HypB/UreG, nucleotide-binding domain